MRFRAPFRRAQGSPVTPIGTLVVLTWATVFLPRVLQTLTAPKYRVEVGEVLSYSPIASVAGRLLQLLLLATCGAIVLSRVRRLPALLGWRLVVLLMPWVFVVANDLFRTGRPGLYAFVYPALVVAVWVLQPRLKELWPMAVAAGSLAAVSLLLGALLPEQGILTNASGRAVDPTKQVLPWGVLVGPLTSGNNLGQVLALSIPATMLLPRRARPATIALMTTALLWTASRSSIVAALAVGLAVLLVTKVVPDLRAGLAGLIAVVALGVAGLVPFLTHDDAAFTNRGYIWRRSIEAWQDSPVVGLGSDYYTRIGGSSDAIVETAYHGHNEVIQLLVTGGWVLLTLFLLLMLTTIFVAARCAGRGEYFPLGLVVALLLSSTFEVSLGFIDRQFVLPAAALPLAVVLLSPDSARRRGRPPGPLVRPQVAAPDGLGAPDLRDRQVRPKRPTGV